MTAQQSGHVGVVGSPSTTTEVTVDLVGDAAHRPLSGSLVMLPQELDGRLEVALGTVVQIETVNQWHENTSMRGVIATHGRLLGLSGRADVKSATVSVQAVYTRDADGYRPSQATLSMSPTTGEDVVRVDDKVLNEIIKSQLDEVFYMGDIYRMMGTRLPLNPSDFSGARGAFHAGVFGPSGVGKSVFTTYYIAGQMRHENLGILVIDPQGQWATNNGFAFNLHDLARVVGREVVIKSLAREVRLPQDKYLFLELLLKTRFFGAGGLNIRTAQAIEAAKSAVEDALSQPKWSELSSGDLLDLILNALLKATEAGDIYKDLKIDKPTGEFKPEGAGWKLLCLIKEVLGTKGDRRNGFIRTMLPVASLFAPQTPDGGVRMKMERLLHLALDRTPPRPFIVLNMAAEEPGDDADEDAQALAKALNSDSVRARILRTLFERLERISGEEYRKGKELLNSLIVFDEAWRYAPKSSSDDEIKALSNKLAEYARETRKYGVGWMYVLQSPSELHPTVWDQLKSGFRAFGFGLSGGDLDLVKQQVDRRESIDLYRSFAQPSTMNPVYPFMLVGAISPLSFTMAPLYMTVYNSFTVWHQANAGWLPEGTARKVRSGAQIAVPDIVYPRTSLETAGDPFI
jgi:DNA helicase HerA-like ATPase